MSWTVKTKENMDAREYRCKVCIKAPEEEVNVYNKIALTLTPYGFKWCDAKPAPVSPFSLVCVCVCVCPSFSDSHKVILGPCRFQWLSREVSPTGLRSGKVVCAWKPLISTEKGCTKFQNWIKNDPEMFLNLNLNWSCKHRNCKSNSHWKKFNLYSWKSKDSNDNYNLKPYRLLWCNS